MHEPISPYIYSPRPKRKRKWNGRFKRISDARRRPTLDVFVLEDVGANSQLSLTSDDDDDDDDDDGDNNNQNHKNVYSTGTSRSFCEPSSGVSSNKRAFNVLRVLSPPTEKTTASPVIGLTPNDNSNDTIVEQQQQRQVLFESIEDDDELASQQQQQQQQQQTPPQSQRQRASFVVATRNARTAPSWAQRGKFRTTPLVRRRLSAASQMQPLDTTRVRRRESFGSSPSIIHNNIDNNNNNNNQNNDNHSSQPIYSHQIYSQPVASLSNIDCDEEEDDDDELIGDNLNHLKREQRSMSPLCFDVDSSSDEESVIEIQPSMIKK